MKDLAAENVMMLTPSLCEACILRQRKKSTTRNVACCVFIVYNVLVLSVVLIMLWYLFDFRDRLDRTVKTVNSLQKHDEGANVHINKPPVEESALAIPEIKERLKRSAGSVEKKNKSRHAGKKKGRRKRCKNDDVKTRLARTATSATPHFYLEGWTSNSDIDATDGNGIFRWKAPPARSFDQGTDFFHADKTSGYLTKVTIVRPGVYFVFAKVTANGRYPHQSDMTPPVGVRLMKNNEVLDVAWTTQDERGKVYSSLRSRRDELDRFPLDTLTIFGLHALDVNDNIYIQRPPEKPYNEPDRFLTGRNRQQFGMFLVENCLNC